MTGSVAPSERCVIESKLHTFLIIESTMSNVDGCKIEGGGADWRLLAEGQTGLEFTEHRSV